jgi:hypothetical protein
LPDELKGIKGDASLFNHSLSLLACQVVDTPIPAQVGSPVVVCIKDVFPANTSLRNVVRHSFKYGSGLPWYRVILIQAELKVSVPVYFYRLLFTENQLTDIVDMIVDDYGSRLTGGEVSEAIGLILENISGYETGNLHDYRYDVRAFINCVLRNRVIYVGKNRSGESTLDQKIIY